MGLLSTHLSKIGFGVFMVFGPTCLIPHTVRAELSSQSFQPRTWVQEGFEVTEFSDSYEIKKDKLKLKLELLDEDSKVKINGKLFSWDQNLSQTELEKKLAQWLSVNIRFSQTQSQAFVRMLLPEAHAGWMTTLGVAAAASLITYLIMKNNNKDKKDRDYRGRYRHHRRWNRDGSTPDFHPPRPGDDCPHG